MGFRLNALLSLFVCLGLTACTAPGLRTQEQMAQLESKDQLTLGKVQQTLRNGMNKTEIISSLGSPNMVTRDRAGAETWIYDKISTEVNSASASDRVGIFGIGVGGSALLGGSGGSSTSANASRRSQKTLTVILKFADEQLTEFSYNTSSF